MITALRLLISPFYAHDADVIWESHISLICACYDSSSMSLTSITCLNRNNLCLLARTQLNQDIFIRVTWLQASLSDLNNFCVSRTRLVKLVKWITDDILKTFSLVMGVMELYSVILCAICGFRVKYFHSCATYYAHSQQEHSNFQLVRA